MLFNPINKKATSLTEQALLSATCAACPLIKLKAADKLLPDHVDVLILSEKNTYQSIIGIKGLRVHHAFMRECGTMDEQNTKDKEEKKKQRTAELCCLGRKLNLIQQLKPKVVIAVGYDTYAAVEEAMGYTPDDRCNNYFQPTEYKQHKFWFVKINDFDVSQTMTGMDATIRRAVAEPPVVLKFDLHTNVELICDSSQIDRAFDILEQMPRLSMDIETKGLRPYNRDKKILSISLGDFNHTFSFPLFHSQTPKNFDVGKVLDRLLKLIHSGVLIIAHNLAFELEWLAFLYSKLGYDGVKDIIYAGNWGDTFLQCFVLNNNQLGKSLNSCLRRGYGDDLKSISNIDVTKLDETPLEQVLTYNAGDVKYIPQHLFADFEKELIETDLMGVYDIHIERIRACVTMQLRGMRPNIEFIVSETQVWQKLRMESYKEWQAYSQVKSQIKRHGHCDPNSNTDIPNLFREEFKVGPEVTSFDVEFLETFKHPIAKTLVELRHRSHILSTYLLPFHPTEPCDTRHVYDDGLMHTAFNTAQTETARLSSTGPNVQNVPSHGGLKYLKNICIAHEGTRFVMSDYSQIEYKVAANLSKDPVMVDGLRTGFDVHTYWTKEILKHFPKWAMQFNITDINDEKQLKKSGARGKVKNSYIFAKIYNAGDSRVEQTLGLTGIGPITEAFWKLHGGLKQWQNQQYYDHDHRGYIMNPFGRRFYAPIKHNGVVNYPIQSAAHDLVDHAMCRLVRKSVEESKPWLCPVLELHDDLSFNIADAKIEEALGDILPIMLDVSPYKEWLMTDIEVEVSIGDTWGGGEEMGVFSSKDWSV